MIKKYIKERIETLRSKLSSARTMRTGNKSKLLNYILDDIIKSEDYYKGAINELEELLKKLD